MAREQLNPEQLLDATGMAPLKMMQDIDCAIKAPAFALQLEKQGTHPEASGRTLEQQTEQQTQQ
jgi:hypothetical protein